MKSLIRVLASALLLASLLAAPSRAESVLIPGSLKGIGTSGPIGIKRLCSPLSIGLNDWRTEWVTGLIKPTENQNTLLRELVADSDKVRHLIADACRNDEIDTATAQLAVIERRVSALAEALRIFRPTYGNFYSSLDSAQKARLDGLGPARRGWRW
jgi:LTXXQ motif family protein